MKISGRLQNSKKDISMQSIKTARHKDCKASRLQAAGHEALKVQVLLEYYGYLHCLIRKVTQPEKAVNILEHKKVIFHRRCVKYRSGMSNIRIEETE